jgi:hypothetical protein
VGKAPPVGATPPGGVFYGGFHDYSTAVDFLKTSGVAGDTSGVKPGTAAFDKVKQWVEARWGYGGGKQNYTSSEWAALQKYGHSSDVNHYLRNPSSSYGTSSYEQQVKNIDTALARNPTKEAFVTYRGIGHGDHGPALRDAPIGSIFKDKGYLSTSVGDRWGGTYKLRIHVPPGVPTAYHPGGTHPQEQEILLPRDTVMVKTGEGEVVGGVYYIDVRVVAVGASPVDVQSAMQLPSDVVIGSLAL